jgi:hypothetical protein
MITMLCLPLRFSFLLKFLNMALWVLTATAGKYTAFLKEEEPILEDN